MRVHILKTWSPWFEATRDGKKPWELRRDDRNYREGDFLVLRQFTPRGEDLQLALKGGCPHHAGKWGDEYVVMRVIWAVAEAFVPPGYVMLSLADATDREFAQGMGEVTRKNEGGIWSGVGALGVR